MANRTVVVTLDMNDRPYAAGAERAARNTMKVAAAGDRMGSSLKSAFAVGAAGAATLTLGKVIKDSVELEAAYSRTMRQIAAQTGAPKKELADLDRLALKMGADTVYSAQDAADAMLSLAKGGLTPAQIRAGALRDTLTLAAAGGLDLGDAADSVVASMGAFRLKANQTNQAVAALAGGANASSASVSDMNQALAQAGTSANAAGLSVQDTTAYLALFANQGFKGSDAGTSLRTMLSRLVPQTKEAAAAMSSVGLSYLDANGNLVDAEEIAGRTQKAFKGLSDEQKISAVNAIFGADAQRAVNAITAEGEAGFVRYKKATSDLSAAQKLAAAGTSGTAGAIEQLKGSIETAEIQIGKGLAPVIEDLANRATDFIGDADIEGWARDAGQGISEFLDEVGPLAGSLLELGQSALPAVATAGGAVVDVLEAGARVAKPFLDAFNALPASAQQAVILAAGAQKLNREFSLTDRLAGSAGGGLLVYGDKAEAAGKKAEKGKRGVSGFTGSLKGTAALAAAFVGLEAAGTQLDRIGATLDQFRDKSDGLALTLDGQGRASGETTKGLLKLFDDQNIIQNADRLGLNVDRLANGLAKGGKDGEYVQKVIDDLYDKTSTFSGASKSTLGNIIPFLDTDESRLDDARLALEDLVDEMDRARAKSSKMELSTRDFLIDAFGVEKYRDELMKVPSEVITKVMTPGAIKSASDMEGLIRKYKLSPDLVRTIVKASGIDLTAEQMREVIGLATRIDRKKSRARVQAAAAKAIQELQWVNRLLSSADRNVNSTVTITRNIKSNFDTPKGGDPKNTTADMYLGFPNRAMGGLVPAGFAGGGIIPGTPPSDSRVDNLLAMGARSGAFIKVRSGEMIVNQEQTRKNKPLLMAVNAGMNVDFDALMGLKSAKGYATGGIVDAVSAAELTQMRIRVRDLRRDLRRREKYKDKSGTERERYATRGLDRVLARQELSEAIQELRGTERANAQARRAGMSATRFNDYRQDRLDEREEARRTLRETRAENKRSFADNADIGAFTSTASVNRKLQNSIGRMAKFTKLLIALRKKRAAPWLLDQFIEEGPSVGAIRLMESYLNDQKALADINAQALVLDQVSGSYARVTADPKFLTTSRGYSAPITGSQTKTLKVEASALDASTVAREIAQQVHHTLLVDAMSAGVSPTGAAL